MAPVAVGAAARRGRLGHHAGHAVAGAGGAGRSGCAGCMLANALVDPVGVAPAEPGARRRPRACRCCPGSTRVRPSPRWTRVLAAAAPRPPADRARRARRAGRPDRGPRPDRPRAPWPTPWPRARTCGWAGSPATRARWPTTPPRPGSTPSAATCATSPHCTPSSPAATRPSEVVVTAGGSAYFDDVADVLGPLRRRRAPACCCARAPTSIHDDGFYRGISPLRPRRRRTAALGDARLGPGRLPARARAGAARRRQARRPVRRGAARAAAGRRRARRPGAPAGRARSPRSTTSTPSCASTRPTPLRRRPRGPAGPVPPVHRLRQVAADPGGRRRRRAPTRSSSTWSAPTSDASTCGSPPLLRRPDSILIRAPPSSTGRSAPATAPTCSSTARGSPRSGHRAARRRPPTGCIDADGLVLCPGFIDMHAHSDLQILLEPDHLAKISQGVTTELLGQDGLSYAPVDDAALAMLREQDRRLERRPGRTSTSPGAAWGSTSTGSTGASPATRPTWSRTAWSGRWSCGWDDVPGHRRRHRARCRRSCAPRWREGAVGLSAGLTYTPGMYADNAELLALCATVGELGGFFAPHHRSYGKGALDAYAEMIDLTTRAGCPLHLSHATMNFAPNKGRAGELLALLDAAIADGADITLDTYPYLPGATTLSAMLPSWSSAGGQDATLARLRDPAALARIRDDLEVTRLRRLPRRGRRVGHHRDQRGHPRRSWAALVGRTIAQIAADDGPRPVRRRSSTSSSATSWAPGSCSTSGTRRTCGRSCATPGTPAGSDGLLVGAKPHPRAWGTFPRYLGHYCRDLGVFSLEECVGHLTGRRRRAAAAARPRPGPRRVRRRPGAVRPRHRRRHRHLRRPAAAGRRHPLRVRQRRARDGRRARAPTRSPAARCAASRTEPSHDPALHCDGAGCGAAGAGRSPRTRASGIGRPARPYRRARPGPDRPRPRAAADVRRRARASR